MTLEPACHFHPSENGLLQTCEAVVMKFASSLGGYSFSSMSAGSFSSLAVAGNIGKHTGAVVCNQK